MQHARHTGILSVVVHPEHRKQGIGRALVDRLIEHAFKSAGLTCVEAEATDAGTIGLYGAAGFNAVDVRVMRLLRADAQSMPAVA